jgi:hypothetical protein
MSTYNSIAWLPLCAGLTGLGLVLSYLTARKRGLRPGLKGAAWSLLPLAAYLTGSIEMFWKIGTAIGNFATSFAFSPKVWSGVAVAGVAVVLFIAGGGHRRKATRERARKRAAKESAAPAVESAGKSTGTLAVPQTKPDPVPASSGRKSKRDKATAGDDDMREIEDILRQHGIK